MLALVETELWPFWIAAAKRRAVPVVIVSGRLSDRSFPRYCRVRRLLDTHACGGSLRWARARIWTQRDSSSWGCPPSVCRPLETSSWSYPPGVVTLAADLVRALSEVPIIVAGSTHPGEEVLASAALDACEKAGLRAALVVAHRDICSEPATWSASFAQPGESSAAAAGSQVTPLAPGEVLLLDTLGELPGRLRGVPRWPSSAAAWRGWAATT